MCSEGWYRIETSTSTYEFRYMPRLTGSVKCEWKKFFFSSACGTHMLASWNPNIGVLSVFSSVLPTESIFQYLSKSFFSFSLFSELLTCTFEDIRTTLLAVICTCSASDGFGRKSFRGNKNADQLTYTSNDVKTLNARDIFFSIWSQSRQQARSASFRHFS